MWYFRDLAYNLPKSVILKLLEINESILNKEYSVEERNELLDELDYIKENVTDINEVEIHRGLEDLVKFLANLIEIKEIGLAKKVFDLANEYNFKGHIAHSYYSYSFNKFLVDSMVGQKDHVFNVLLNFIGEKDFISNFENIIISTFESTFYIKKLLNKLVKLEKYDLFIKIIDLLILEDYNESGKIIKIMLPHLQKAIESSNNNLLIKYLDILNLALDNELHLKNLNKRIEKAEQDKS